MAISMTLQRTCGNPGRVSGRQQTRVATASQAISMAPRPSRANAVTPQAFCLTPYSCRPDRYSRSPLPRLSSVGLLGSMLASDVLRKSTSSVHPIDIKSFDDRYELHSDCPGMGEEDLTLEISPSRVLTIAGSRKTIRKTLKPRRPDTATAAPSASTDSEDMPGPSAAAASETTDPSSSVSVSYRFSRSFVLPEDAVEEDVAAALDRGVLTVTVPRRVQEKPQPRRVSIKTSSA